MFYLFLILSSSILKKFSNFPPGISRFYYLHRESRNRDFYLSNSVPPFLFKAFPGYIT